MVSPRLSARAVIVENNKILLVNAHPKIRGQNTWCTPGGGVDAGEDLVSALKREVYEELGVDIHVGDVFSVSEYMSGDTHQIDILFMCKLLQDIDQSWRDLDHVVEDRHFFSLEELHDVTVFPNTLKQGLWRVGGVVAPVYNGVDRK